MKKMLFVLCLILFSIFCFCSCTQVPVEGGGYNQYQNNGGYTPTMQETQQIQEFKVTISYFEKRNTTNPTVSDIVQQGVEAAKDYYDGKTPEVIVENGISFRITDYNPKGKTKSRLNTYTYLDPDSPKSTQIPETPQTTEISQTRETQETTQTGNNEEVICHYPEEGQGLKEIARIYGCDFQELLDYNGLNEDSIIYMDQPIYIPPKTNNYQIAGIEVNSYDPTQQEQDSNEKHEPGYYAGVTYTTDYNSLLNIEHACSDINGIIVPAYYRFSWFKNVGPCIDGYEEALVIDDTYVPTPENPNPTAKGGGVCVVSSCLRNAVEAVVGENNILEAHNHTRNGEPVDMSYATIGHQASLNYRSMDFKFYNPYPYSLKIESYFDWDTQTCYVSVIPQ